MTETHNTLDLLAETDIDYVSDWCNDELPYWITTRSRRAGPLILSEFRH